MRLANEAHVIPEFAQRGALAPQNPLARPDIAIESDFDFTAAEYRGLFARSDATAFQHPLWLDRFWFYARRVPGTGADSAPHRHLFPLNFFTIDATRSRKWLPLALTMSVASAAIGVTISETI